MQRSIKAFVRDQPTLRDWLLRVGSLARTIERAEAGIYTLCYHHVSMASASNFSSQISFFKRFGEFITADTAIDWIASGTATRKRGFLLTFDDGYADNVEIALPVIKQQGVPAILFLVSNWIDAMPREGNRYMTRADVRIWAAAGLDIGSHSATHRRLSQLDEASVIAELGDSREQLSILAERSISHFACPWGVADFDYLTNRDPGLAARTGYRTFFTTRRGKARATSDILSMPRHVMEPEWPTYQIEALMGGPRYARG